MKDDIQARLRKRRAKMSPEQIEEDIRQVVSHSDAPVAKLWRRLSRQVADPPGTARSSRR
jgi:hypothetical protein